MRSMSAPWASWNQPILCLSFCHIEPTVLSFLQAMPNGC